jgi:hypothetical protein
MEGGRADTVSPVPLKPARRMGRNAGLALIRCDCEKKIQTKII